MPELASLGAQCDKKHAHKPWSVSTSDHLQAPLFCQRCSAAAALAAGQGNVLLRQFTVLTRDFGMSPFSWNTL